MPGIDVDIRVVVLAGEGEAFCSGLDLSSLAERDTPGTMPGRSKASAAAACRAQRLADGPPLALAWTKLSLNAMLKQLTLGAFETSIAYDLLSLRTDDVREGNEAFFEKRTPKFTGT
jgi:enoyl-CoA hydratase/carnithine racemase